MSNNLLAGKKGIIFGALDEKSIAWKTALACHGQGAQIVLTNAPVALRMGEINKLAEAIQAPVIGADVTNADDSIHNSSPYNASLCERSNSYQLNAKQNRSLR